MSRNRSTDELDAADRSQAKPKKLLLLTTELRPGGAEKCLTNLACGLDPARFQPIVVSIKSIPDASERRLVDRLQQAGIPTHFLDCDSKWSLWKAARKLKNLIQVHEVELVQSFLIHANMLAGFVLRHFPQIRFFTGIRVADPSRIRHKTEKWLTRRAERIVCVSRQVKEFAATKMGLPQNKLVAIPNGIETPTVDPDFSPSALGIQTPYVLFVGRLEEQKGLVKFLDEFTQRDDSLPDFDLVLAGEGSQKTQLEKSTVDLRHKFHWIGWHSNPQDLMVHAACTVLPSLWEGMPNVLLETMSLAKPFVAFGVDGVRELVEDDDLQVVPAGNYEKLFASLSELVSSEQLARELGLSNQKRVEENFSLKKMIAKYEALYLDCPDDLNAR